MIIHGSIITLPESEKKALYSRWLLLSELAGVLGLRAELNQAKLSPNHQKVNDEHIKTAIKQRKAARLSKDFKKADQIREDLKNQGIFQRIYVFSPKYKFAQFLDEPQALPRYDLVLGPLYQKFLNF